MHTSHCIHSFQFSSKLVCSYQPADKRDSQTEVVVWSLVSTEIFHEQLYPKHLCSQLLCETSMGSLLQSVRKEHICRPNNQPDPKKSWHDHTCHTVVRNRSLCVLVGSQILSSCSKKWEIIHGSQLRTRLTFALSSEQCLHCVTQSSLLSSYYRFLVQ